MADLEAEDFHLLSGVEQGMRFSEYVDREKIPKFSRLTAENVDYRLDRCEDRGFLERKTIQYEGFKLTFEGYDALALHTLVERGTIKGFGAPLGVGKESDVYEVRSYKTTRAEVPPRGVHQLPRGPEGTRIHVRPRPRLLAVHRAQGRRAGVRGPRDAVPRRQRPQPIDQNRHAIVMEKLAGVELARTKLEDESRLSPSSNSSSTRCRRPTTRGSSTPT